ncbi:MAG: hypothetical protein ACOYD4_00775 [Solirubrobacterales bacterium]
MKSSRFPNGLRWTPAATCLTVFGLAAVATAAASPTVVPRPSRTRLNSSTFTERAEFTLHASNGYRIVVSGEVEGQRQSSITLTAARGATSASYIAEGRVTENGMHASFGRLGAISLRFHLAQKHRIGENLDRCFGGGGPAAESRLGSLVGTVRFRGEHDYTKVLAHRVQGGIHESVTCGHDPFGPVAPQAPKAVLLSAQTPDHRSDSISFEATTYPREWIKTGNPLRGGPDLFVALTGERSEGMLILRFVLAKGPKSDFTYDSALSSATVTPPPPFSGSGSFLRGADGSTSWTGSLSAPVPGLGQVSLVEPGLTGELETRAQLFESLE